MLGAFCRSVTFLFSKSQSKFEDIGFNQKLDKVGAACFTSVWLDWPRFGWTSRQEQYAGPSTNSQPALTCVINLWSLKMYKCCNALQWCPLSMLQSFNLPHRFHMTEPTHVPRHSVVWMMVLEITTFSFKTFTFYILINYMQLKSQNFAPNNFSFFALMQIYSCNPLSNRVL